jgi:hypothetical protein
MATLSPVSSTFRLGSNSIIRQGVAGEALSAFDFVYADSTDNKELKKADNTNTTKYECVGVVIQDAADGEPVSYVLIQNGAGTIQSSSSLWTAGQTYVVADTAGRMMDAGDIGASDYVFIIGTAASTTELNIVGRATEASG